MATAPTMAVPNCPKVPPHVMPSQHEIHNESHTATFHQLACTETCQTSNNN